MSNEISESENVLVDLCSKGIKDDNDLKKFKDLLKQSDISINATDKDGMTALMHAAYGGNFEVCHLLLENGVDVNSNLHCEGYTALMFATIAGHPKIVDLLLRSGAKVDIVNSVGRTAAQLGGFVGQHEAVETINNFFSITELQYYTKPQGLEKVPKLDPSLLQPLHSYITTINLHPVGLILTLQSTTPNLIDHHHNVCKVMDILCEKAMKNDNEPFSLKLHYLAYTLRHCSSAESIESVIKCLLVFGEHGEPIEIEKFMRQSLKQFPHVYSVLLKQMVATLSKIPLGATPTTLSLFTTSILGNRSFDEQNTCSTCGIRSDELKKCSKCKHAFYCGIECQKLAWTMGNHKKLCKKWSKQLMSTDEVSLESSPHEKQPQ